VGVAVGVIVSVVVGVVVGVAVGVVVGVAVGVVVGVVVGAVVGMYKRVIRCGYFPGPAGKIAMRKQREQFCSNQPIILGNVEELTHSAIS
jgi:hypothetical protein